jgi:hypothetical protein
MDATGADRRQLALRSRECQPTTHTAHLNQNIPEPSEDIVPTYQYVCTDCDAPLEVVQSFSDDALTDCPACTTGRLRKVYGSVGVVFKGSGFYRNDSRSASTSTSPASTSTGSDSGSSSDSSTSSSGSAGSSSSSDSGSSSSAPASAPAASSTAAAS